MAIKDGDENKEDDNPAIRSIVQGIVPFDKPRREMVDSAA